MNALYSSPGRLAFRVLTARRTQLPQTLIPFCGNAGNYPVGSPRILDAPLSTFAYVPAPSAERFTARSS